MFVRSELISLLILSSMYNTTMTIQHKLVQWYHQNKRELPFRINQDPYRVWISEMMAQQTQMETILPYYNRWMHQFPTLKSCALADEIDILQAWAGLGYYSRARNLHKTAQIIFYEHHGLFPTQALELEKLPGIGPYSAAAIASICFSEPVAAIDGNVKRVMSRLFLWDEIALKKQFTAKLQLTIQTWMKSEQPADVTQAIMELGALICTKQAACLRCPLNTLCLAYQHNEVQNFPKVRLKKAKTVENIEVVCLIHHDRTFALTLECEDNLMKGYYRLPTLTQAHLNADDTKLISQARHVFTHKIWELSFYQTLCSEKDPRFVWISFNQINKFPIITAHLKWLNKEALHL
jgi:A/G-specific adenine glycosylase